MTVMASGLATALAVSGERGRIYVVELLGPFYDDPNVTNNRFPSNATQSYRARHPLRVVGAWIARRAMTRRVVKGMLDHLALLRGRLPAELRASRHSSG